MIERFPLTALLSQALVAFTIEFDNEAERRIAAASPRRAFRVSLPFWANFMRFVPVEGIAAADLRSLAGVSKSSIRSRLGELARWGYAEVEPSGVVRPTAAGRFAQAIWRPLAGEIEARWTARFGHREFAELRRALGAIAERLETGLPRYLPIVGYDMFSTVERLPREDTADIDLSALLSKVLLAFALDFERDSRLSLPHGSNVLRVAVESATPLRDFPRLTGIAKETVAVSLGFLAKRGLVEIVSRADVRGKSARLTAQGVGAKRSFERQLAVTETRWQARFGERAMLDLRAALVAILSARDGDGSRLARGLVPHEGCWRACKPYLTQTEAMLRDPIAALPQYPIVTHRGGWPDGS